MVAASLLGDTSSQKVDEVFIDDAARERLEALNNINRMTDALVILILAILFSLAWRDPVQRSRESSLTRKNPFKK